MSGGELYVADGYRDLGTWVWLFRCRTMYLCELDRGRGNPG